MKTKLITLALFGLLVQIPTFAQDVTTVNATSTEISDNLDLRAVASIFGDSKNLEDFERRLNDPKNQISNLDLNYDRQVDYLRVIEAVEKNTHLIILQAVLEKDVFQDVATIEVERGSNNQVQVQVVGNVYMYGANYIYEPVYVTRPLIYNVFWVSNYHPYCSPYYFNYYPTYYYAWTPYPVYRYRRNVHVHINQYNYYNYSNHRRSSNAVALYQGRRSNGYEKQHPNRSFATRNNATNRYELDQSRSSGSRIASANTRTYTSPRNNTRNSELTKSVRTSNPKTKTVRNTGSNNTVRSSNANAVRTTTNRSETTRNYAQKQQTRQVEQKTNASRKASPSNNNRPTNTRSAGASSGSRNSSRG